MADVDEPVSLSDYDPAWPVEFAREETRLREALAGVLRSIEHIGSTAVPGLTAKPIVDLMIGVAPSDDHNTLAEHLAPLGYEDCGGAPGRRYLRRRGDSGQFNVQIVEHKGSLWDANLLFRDYLRADPDAARRYGEAKRLAATKAPMLLAYSELKKHIIGDLLREASAKRV